jgi:hypothetical protein
MVVGCGDAGGIDEKDSIGSTIEAAKKNADPKTAAPSKSAMPKAGDPAPAAGAGGEKKSSGGE